MNGSPGGHAGAARPGQSGGRVVVSLHEEGVALARVRGVRRLPDGSQEAIDEHVVLGDAGFVDLLARGGAGGRGGDGGRGGAGATGHRGSDATRYSSGSNGGEGGDGGRGGNATSGADGGPGGSVIARVDDADTHLLMLVRAGVEGGAGGAPGVHGGGGAGGPGGAGGSSHSWTESETYRDSNGNTQTRTTYHSNSGGSSGPSGRSGQSGAGPLFSGRNGDHGAFAIEVLHGDSVHRYPARYHLMLTAIRLSTEDRDDVFEPGEIVRVDGLRVRNVGHMPTPSTRAITIEARDSRWCSTLEDERLEVPRSVPAGVEVEVPGTISFELRDHAPTDPDDPLIASDRVTLRAHVPDVNRSFEGFEPDVLTLAATMKVRFPIAASVLQGLSALAPGEVTRIRFAVRNQSKKALGARSEGRRRVRARLSLFESELGDESVALIDEHGKRSPLAGEGLVRELELLEAGADWIFEGALAMREGAPAYRELRLRLTLEIGRLDMPDVLRVVQHRELRVRCVRPLAPSARMDWLLVANHRTARDEIDAWEALAREMQRTLVVWDVSLQGHLALEAPRDDGAPVLERLGGGLVVVLGYPMDTAFGELRAHELLAPGTLARAAEERVDVLLAGGAAPSLDVMLAPETSGDETAPADGERALLARIERHATQSDHAFVECAEIFEIGFAFEDASRARLESRAKALAEELATRFPQRRCVVVWDFAPEPRSSWLLVKRSRIGTIRVLARPAARNAVASLVIDDLKLGSPEFVRSDACRIALAVASGPDDQIEALVRALEAGDVRRAAVWADALLVGLASEQLAMLRRTRWGADLSLRAMRAQLPRLERLSRASLLGAHAASSEVGELIASLAARLLFYADSQARLWEKIPPLSFFRRAPGLDVITEQLVRELVSTQCLSQERLAPEGPSVRAARSRPVPPERALVSTQSSDDDARRVLRDRIVVAQRAIRAEWKAASPGIWGALDRAEWARDRVLAPVAAEHLTTDDELLVSDAGTAIELPDWRALRSRAKAGEQLRDEVVATLATQRSELLLSVRAAELLGERAPIAARVVGSHSELASGDHAADQARERAHAT